MDWMFWKHEWTETRRHAVVIGASYIIVFPLAYVFGYQNGKSAGEERWRRDAAEIAGVAASAAASSVTNILVNQEAQRICADQLATKERGGFERCSSNAQDADDLERFYKTIKSRIAQAAKSSPASAEQVALARVIIEMKKHAVDALHDIAARTLNGKLDQLSKAVDAQDAKQIAVILSEIQGSMDTRDISFKRAQEELRKAQAVK